LDTPSNSWWARDRGPGETWADADGQNHRASETQASQPFENILLSDRMPPNYNQR